MTVIIGTSLIVLLASTLQSTVGFSLVAVPLLSMLLPLKVVVPIIVVYNLQINSLVMASAYKFVRARKILMMIIFGVIGIPIGIYGLKNINQDVMLVTVGILITITSISMITGFKVKTNNEKLSYSLVGLVSGILNGSCTLSGPPVVLFLSNEGYTRDEFRASMAFNGVITNIIALAMFLAIGSLNKNLVFTMGINSVFLLLGGTIGVFASKKINDKIFRVVVLSLLTVIGALTTIRSLNI